jgi:hypothetical protein
VLRILSRCHPESSKLGEKLPICYTQAIPKPAAPPDKAIYQIREILPHIMIRSSSIHCHAPEEESLTLQWYVLMSRH